MFERHRLRLDPKLVKVTAAIVVGLSVGTMLPPTSMTLPMVGTVSSLLIGGAGLVIGGALFRWGPKQVGTASCGCAGDCGCS